MYSVINIPTLPGTGSPIRTSPDQSLFADSPKLFASYYVLHRLLTPRHPPSALHSLATKFMTHYKETFI